MDLSLLEIRRHRAGLVERARVERGEVRALFDSQRELLGVADIVLAAIRYLAARKDLLLLSALAFAVTRPRRSLRWALNGWKLYRFARRLRRALLA